MSAVYDIVVVGGGSNTLTAAAYLAKVGKRVLVLEKNADCGGGVVSIEPAPGFVCDPHATGMVTCIPNPVVARDELALHSRFGLEWAWSEASFGSVFDDGAGLVTYRDLERTCGEIARYSARDAEAYRAFVEECRGYLPLLLKGFYAPPLPFDGFVSLLGKSAKGRRLVDAMLSSAYDVIVDRFESPELRAHLIKWVAEIMVGPETRGTGIVPFLLLGIAHAVRAGAVVGGSRNLTAALVRCFEAHGGTVRTRAEVAKIDIAGGRARGVVLGDGERIAARDAVVGCIHPWDLDRFLGDAIDPTLAAAARRVKLSEYGCINQQYALSEAPRWKAGDHFRDVMLVECVRRTSDLLPLRRSFDDYRYGRMPPCLSPVCAVQSNLDPSRAPPGKATLYLYHFAPMLLAEGGLDGWAAIKERTADAIFEEFCRYTVNIDRGKVIARHVEAPPDHHRHSASMKHGDIFGIGTYTSQFFGRRPLPELAQYRVPGLDGFYLCGPFMHPGGTVTLGGRATAMRMLMDWKIDLHRAFVSI